MKSASKIGSSTSFSADCTTGSAAVRMPRRRSFPFDLGGQSGSGSSAGQWYGFRLRDTAGKTTESRRRNGDQLLAIRHEAWFSRLEAGDGSGGLQLLGDAVHGRRIPEEVLKDLPHSLAGRRSEGGRLLV